MLSHMRPIELDAGWRISKFGRPIRKTPSGGAQECPAVRAGAIPLEKGRGRRGISFSRDPVAPPALDKTENSCAPRTRDCRRKVRRSCAWDRGCRRNLFRWSAFSNRDAWWQFYGDLGSRCFKRCNGVARVICGKVAAGAMVAGLPDAAEGKLTACACQRFVPG